MIEFLTAVKMYAPTTLTILTRLGITQWEDVTPESLTEFREYTAEHRAQNTARELCMQLSNAINKGGGAKVPRCLLRLEQEHNERPYLTCAEIKRLAALEPVDDTDKKVLYQYLVMCRTGISLSDVMRLKEDNIVTENWSTYLSYTNSATKRPAKVLISKTTAEQIRFLMNFPEDSNSYGDTYRTHRRIVKMLRSAAITELTWEPKGENKDRKVPKWKTLNHRNARVSFCTNLYNAGVHPLDIGRMIGIESIEKIFHYISAPRGAALTTTARVYLGL